jgi:hypothetical protein
MTFSSRLTIILHCLRMLINMDPVHLSIVHDEMAWTYKREKEVQAKLAESVK